MEAIIPDPIEQNLETQFADPIVSDWEKSIGQDLIDASAMVCDWGAKLDPSGKLGRDSIGVSATEQDENLKFLADSMVCDSGSRLVLSGFKKPSCTDDVVYFINAGSETPVESDSSISFVPDKFYQGGDTFQTEEFISEGGDYFFIYQSARLGNFTYHVPDLARGEYFVDLHFVEIINMNGPKGMRMFDVFLQDEKVLSDFDIFSVVGANKPLQLVDSRVSIKDDGVLTVKFEGIVGSPVVSGICIRRAPNVSAATQTNHEHLICTNCASEVELPSAQKKAMRLQSTTKYEKKIQELSEQLQRKTDECYQSWMSYSAANQHLEKVRMELDNKIFQTYSLDQNLEKQASKLTEISSRYEQDKRVWRVAITNLEQKVKIMKQEQSQLSREAHECVDSIPDLTKMVSAVQSLVDQCEDLKFKYNEEQAKRRKLFNEVQEAKGNIRVFCRCRPLSKAEASAGCSTVVDFDAAKDGELGILNGSSTKKTFKFDRVYTPKDDQADVYADASPMVISVLDGYNVCIFAYGQTGTGKTFTMEGNEGNRGVNYRTLEELFKIANERGETFTYDISVSVLEVYNEQIRDLLSTSSTSSSKKLEIKQASEGSHHIPGIVEAGVKNIGEVWSVLQAGSSARAVGSNNVNEHSSRSHCMLCIMVRAKNLISGECTKSKLWLVDLAGSERLAKTDVQGDRLKEAQNINRSLSALGDVISALANKSSHIPYRNSKLTHLLQDSLGGDSKTLMFVQISPSDKDVSETLSSLNFATRVRGVELGPARKQIDTSEIQKLKTMLDKARNESRSKEESLKKLEESLRFIETKAREKEQAYKSQQDELRELKAQLELKASSQSQSEKQILHISDRLKGSEETCATLQKKVADLEKKLREQGQTDYENYKNKVKEIEDRLKEQLQESESRSVILQLKVEELEKKLKEQENNTDSTLLHEKIKELEEKVKEKEQQLEAANTAIAACSAKSSNEPMNETENHILRNSNALNTQTPVSLPKQKEPVQEVIRRKRLSTNSEPENANYTALPPSSSSLSKRKEHETVHEVRRKRLSRSEAENAAFVVVPSGRNARKSDPPKQFAAGTVKIAKPSVATASQRHVVRSNVSRDQAQGVKERDTKKRMWTR